LKAQEVDPQGGGPANQHTQDPDGRGHGPQRTNVEGRHARPARQHRQQAAERRSPSRGVVCVRRGRRTKRSTRRSRRRNHLLRGGNFFCRNCCSSRARGPEANTEHHNTRGERRREEEHARTTRVSDESGAAGQNANNTPKPDFHDPKPPKGEPHTPTKTKPGFRMIRRRVRPRQRGYHNPRVGRRKRPNTPIFVHHRPVRQPDPDPLLRTVGAGEAPDHTKKSTRTDATRHGCDTPARPHSPHATRTTRRNASETPSSRERQHTSPRTGTRTANTR
jgi:hypothetical protein